jgi:hypothetical protein
MSVSHMPVALHDRPLGEKKAITRNLVGVGDDM